MRNVLGICQKNIFSKIKIKIFDFNFRKNLSSVFQISKFVHIINALIIVEQVIVRIAEIL